MTNKSSNVEPVYPGKQIEVVVYGHEDEHIRTISRKVRSFNGKAYVMYKNDRCAVRDGKSYYYIIHWRS